MITVSCGCGERFQVPDDAAGQRTTCPACGRVHRVGDEGEGWPEVEAAGPKSTSGKAVASLIFGVLSFVCNILAGIPAIILGILSLSDIKKSRGRLSGQGLAITGIVLGAVGSLIIFPLMFFAVQKTREAANRMQSSNNLKQISLALLNYESTHRRFPPAVKYDAQGRPLHSWRVLILPYLEEDLLYSQLDLNQPWDSPRNKPLLSRIPKVYQHPSVNAPPGDLTTVYQVFVGQGALFEAGPQAGGIMMQRVRDGLSNTIMVVEAANGVHWAKPEDIPFDPDGPLPRIGVPSQSGAQVAFGDGAVKWLPKDIDDKTLRAMITRAGGDQFVFP